MDANERKYIDGLVTITVGCAYEVANQLGCGFLEKVYEKAMLMELESRGVASRNQVALPIRYKGVLIGNYVADLLIEKRLLLELKCVDALTDRHIAQCINYMKASGISICLLMNFKRSKVEWKRLVYKF